MRNVLDELGTRTRCGDLMREGWGCMGGTENTLFINFTRNTAAIESWIKVCS